MQRRNWIIGGVAVVIALFAVYLTNAFFSGVQKVQQREAEAQKLSQIVVASQDMAFGTPLAGSNLRLANWPASSIPTGAFTTVEDAMRNGRVATRPMVIGEPVLASKVSGARGRAVLSNNLAPGKVAFAVPISEVAGVAGFVQPGDRVDVILTRVIPGDGANAATDKMSDVILEGAPVLAVGQSISDRATKAEVAKTATLEVDTYGAQKLALGIQLGNLSLALRNVADQAMGARTTVIPRQLSTSNYFIPEKRSGGSDTMPSAAAMQARAQTVAAAIRPALQGLTAGLTGTAPSANRGPKMTVYKGSQPVDYEVQRGY